MSGGRVPYHLRTNKAIDRHVFVDLLTRVHGCRNLSKYAYVGLGGPFLEDFRLVHSQLGLTKLISLEKNESVLPRQRFNRPLSNIKCRNMTSGDFITNYSIDTNAIIWLDYAAAKEQRQQLEELQMLLPKLRAYDLVKITVNATPDTLGATNSPLKDRGGERLRVLKERIGDLLPNDVNEDQMTMKGLARLMYGAILRASAESLKGLPDLSFLPLTAFRYSDSLHQMVTVTGILIGPTEKRRFLIQSGIGKWNLHAKDGSDPIHIEVPALSVRERLFVDARLPRRSGKQISKALGFWCGEDEDQSIEMLNSYARFFRHLPYFSRVVP